MPHADFQKAKTKLWDFFLEKDYENAARTAATMLQDSFALDAIHVAGLALTGLGRMDEGPDWLCASLSLANAKPDWYANAALACLDKTDYLHAMLYVQEGIKDYPQDIRLSYMRGLIMCHSQCWDQALTFLDETLKLDPTFYHATMSKGFCCHMLGRYEEACELYKTIYDTADLKDREEIINNHACVLLELGKQDESLALLDKEYPNSTRPGTVYNRSFLLLGKGMWPQAWHDYRERATVQIKGDQGLPTVEQPIAKTLDDIKGKHLFLHHEQGLGDCIQFIRYARMFRPLVSELTIGVPKPLKRLAENLLLDGDFTVVADAELDKPIFTKCDVAVPMLDSPALFNTTVDTIPGGVPYFNVPQDVINRNQLRETCKPRIGLVWAGASRPENIRAHSIDKRRSVPFEMLNPILDLHQQFEFVSLQLPDHRVEDDHRLLQPLCSDLAVATAAQVEQTPDAVVKALTDRFDVLDTAGIIQQLDLVITIDSSLVHLAGALGKPVWMLSRYDQCWRWFWDGRTDSSWYPTLKIYQQKAHHTWSEVVERVVADLRDLREMDFLTFAKLAYAD